MSLVLLVLTLVCTERRCCLGDTCWFHCCDTAVWRDGTWRWMCHGIVCCAVDERAQVSQRLAWTAACVRSSSYDSVGARERTSAGSCTRAGRRSNEAGSRERTNEVTWQSAVYQQLAVGSDLLCSWPLHHNDTLRWPTGLVWHSYHQPQHAEIEEGWLSACVVIDGLVRDPRPSNNLLHHSWTLLLDVTKLVSCECGQVEAHHVWALWMWKERSHRSMSHISPQGVLSAKSVSRVDISEPRQLLYSGRGYWISCSAG